MFNEGAGLKGITNQPTRLKVMISTGATKKTKALALVGTTISLHKSFNPSAKGCKSPKIPTTFGPRRRWMEAIIFRSAKVK
jgi:hypothetical protein